MPSKYVLQQRGANGLENKAEIPALENGKIDMSWLPVVGESGAAIIARGSNANGEWVRWEDGTQVCWLKQAGQGIAVNQAFNGMYRSESLQWTFPAQFNGDMNYLSFNSAGAFGVITYTNNASHTTGIIYWLETTTANTLLWFAIGRWK